MLPRYLSEREAEALQETLKIGGRAGKNNPDGLPPGRTIKDMYSHYCMALETIGE